MKKKVLKLDELDTVTPMSQFLKTGRAKHTWRGCSLVRDDNSDYSPEILFVIKKNKVFRIVEYTGNPLQECNNLSDLCGTKRTVGVPCGVVVPSNSTKSEFLFVQNGDKDDSGSVCNLPDHQTLTLSFACLSRLLHGERMVKKTIDNLASRNLQIIDYTPDKVKRLTSDQRKLYRHKVVCRDTIARLRGLCKPQVGWTLMYLGGTLEWHQSAAVVVFDKKKQVTYLLGQDDGIYFGCQLIDHPETVREAYMSLTPREARVKGVTRQGEWFAVPTLVSKLPAWDECLCTLEGDDQFSLPRVNHEGNEHCVVTRNIGRALVSTGGVFVRNADICHEEHEVMELPDKWFKLVRNTAVKSVSEEGVD